MRVDIRFDTLVGLDDVFQVDVDKVVERIDMLLDQTLDLQERWQQLPLVLIFPISMARKRMKRWFSRPLSLFRIKKLPQLVARNFRGWHRVTHLDGGDGVCESLATKEGLGMVLSLLDTLFNVSLCVLHVL